MKYGMRKPSIKKSISARTRGRATRAVKRALIPGYGKKGMGLLHPQNESNNKVYRKTTFGLGVILQHLKCPRGPAKRRRPIDDRSGTRRNLARQPHADRRPL